VKFEQNIIYSDLHLYYLNKFTVYTFMLQGAMGNIKDSCT